MYAHYTRITVAVTIAAAAAIAIYRYTAPIDPSVADAQRRAQLERIDLDRQRARDLADLQTAVAAFWTIAPALATIAGAGATLYAIHRHYQTARPDARGLYPLPAAGLADAAPALAMVYHQTQAIAAANQQRPTPDHVTYAPHVITRATPAELAPPEDTGAGSATAPTFAQLLDTGSIAPGRPLLLGYTLDGPLTGSWRDLYSSAIAGISGSGKTTTARFLAAQSALQGARFAVIDPHADAGSDSLAATLQPLEPAFLCDPAADDKRILATVRQIRAHLDARIHGREPARTPIILCIDEFTALMGRSALAAPLAEVVEMIAQEGRKAQVFVLLSGQIWDADRAGGTALRDSLASAYIHRSRRRQIQMLLGLGEALPNVADLATGTALLYRTSGELVTVAIPDTRAEDMRRVGDIMHTTQHASTIPLSPATMPLPARYTAAPAEVEAGTQGSAAAAAAEAGGFTVEERRIIDLLREGRSQREIISQIYGATAGARYQTAARTVNAAIAKALQAQP